MILRIYLEECQDELFEQTIFKCPEFIRISNWIQMTGGKFVTQVIEWIRKAIKMPGFVIDLYKDMMLETQLDDNECRDIMEVGMDFIDENMPTYQEQRGQMLI